MRATPPEGNRDRRGVRCGELDDAMATARTHDGGAYVEVATDRYAAPPLAERLHDNLATLYGS
jgi:indolepyruvate decarboxylase